MAAEPSLPSCDDRRMWDVMMSVYHFPTMTAADDLGVFAFLAATPATAEEVGRKFSLSARATEALLGTLASLGFLARHEARFYVTDVARNYLLPSSPFYWGGMLRFMRDFPFTRQALQEALVKDRPKIYEGQDMWETHEMDPKLAEAFTAAMHARHVGLSRAMALRCDFAGVARFLDVAGGSGVFSIAVAQRHPSVRCTVAELPAVVKLAERYVADAGVADRVDVRAVEMFREKWPTGHDAVFLSNIFHDWDDRKSLHLARKAFECLPSGGRLMVHEILLADTRDGPLTAATDSMHMMFFTEGKQRSVGEFDALFREAGFRDTAVTPTSGYYSVVTARKP
jgi:cyclopropane fatty-acyl-phospholipid synthase-like methyltransferase